MAQLLMQKFNELTANEFDFLKLESVDVDVKAESVSVNLIYPEPYEKKVRASADAIKKAIISCLTASKNNAVTAEIIVKLTKSHFDADFFKASFLKFFDDFPSIAPYVFVENLKIEQLEQYHFSIKLYIDDDICEYALKHKVPDAVKKMLIGSYCEQIDFEFIPVEPANPIGYIEEAEEELRNYVYQTNDGHFIVPENVEEFIGSIIYDRAGYISDARREASGVVYCGTVSEFSECVRKPKEGETEEKKFYKFTLTDPTGSLKCLYFPRKSKKKAAKHISPESNIVNLHDGKQVVVKGSLKESTFRGVKSYDMFVNAISLCTLPEDLSIVQNEFRAKKDYTVVSPQRYVEATQATLFDVKEETPQHLLNKTFCVFDVETTGFDTTTCKIIELAGAKIVNGVITETLSTYVNPHEPIPERITALTSITDADVQDAPDIGDVLADFYKFSENTILVGHNVTFDVGFLNAEGRAHHIYFSNPKEDTYELSRNILKSLKNHKLNTVAKHFGVLNEHAHRAIHDTIATAKVFIKLAAFIE